MQRHAQAYDDQRGVSGGSVQPAPDSIMAASEPAPGYGRTYVPHDCWKEFCEAAQLALVRACSILLLDIWYHDWRDGQLGQKVVQVLENTGWWRQDFLTDQLTVLRLCGKLII